MNLVTIWGIFRRRTLPLFCTAAVLSVSLCGCASGNEETYAENADGLSALGEIHLVAREDGSGTRNAFAQLLDFDTAGEDGASDLTDGSAEIAGSTSDVIAAVEKNNSAIGYVSLASVTDNDNVKILKVDGYDVSEKSYPLERTFYLTYMGKLNSLQEDFLRYVTGKGQTIVAESYEPVSSSKTFLSSNSSGTIRIGGSTSSAPLINTLAQSYMEINPNAKIIITETDSTDGLTGAMAGTYDFGMASRELESYEAELLEQTGIAVDKIAVIVQKDNPLESISADDLRAVYTGEITSWENIVTYQ